MPTVRLNAFDDNNFVRRCYHALANQHRFGDKVKNLREASNKGLQSSHEALLVRQYFPKVGVMKEKQSADVGQRESRGGAPAFGDLYDILIEHF